MTKRFLTLLTICGFILTTTQTLQAQLSLPAPSPGATVKQTVGLTDITIEYSSPGVKDRTIFGGLLAYNSIWRTGANSSTKITFSKDVTVEGVKVAKGTYALLTIPMQAEFTVILSKDAGASENSYKVEEDAARFNVKTKACESRERLTFMFSNFTDNKTSIDMEWEKTRVSFSVSVDTDAQALDNIGKELGRTWRTYNSAARYHLDNKKELETGMKYVDQSISLKEEWFNTWTKAQLYSAMNRKADAYKYAMKAKELGDKNPDGFFFKDNVEMAIKEWAPSAGTKGKK